MKKFKELDIFVPCLELEGEKIEDRVKNENIEDQLILVEE